MNYKRMRFTNSLRSFKIWTEEFPNVLSTCSKDQRKFYDRGDFYCSVEPVIIMGVEILGYVFRKYDEESSDFIHVSEDEGKEIFADVIRRIERSR